MTDAQLYVAIGVPVIVLALGMKIAELDTRITVLEDRSNRA